MTPNPNNEIRKQIVKCKEIWKLFPRNYPRYSKLF